jgi:hypothetical protein
MFDKPGIGVEIAVDRTHTSVAAAGPLAARTAVEIVAHLGGSDTAATVAELCASYPKTLAVVIDPRSPAATLIEPLRALRIIVTEVSPRDVAIAHGRFLDELNAGRLKITPHPALDAAAQHALARPLAGGEALERRKPVVDTSPLSAAELAVWAVLSESLAGRAAVNNVW